MFSLGFFLYDENVCYPTQTITKQIGMRETPIGKGSEKSVK